MFQIVRPLEKQSFPSQCFRIVPAGLIIVIIVSKARDNRRNDYANREIYILMTSFNLVSKF